MQQLNRKQDTSEMQYFTLIDVFLIYDSDYIIVKMYEHIYICIHMIM
jgi:hypothetical protein